MPVSKTKRRIGFAAFLLIFLPLALGSCRNRTDGPPVIRYGKDVCGECRMIISEERFAAAAADRNGNAVKFDGVGCLLRYRQEHPELEKIWVKSYGSGEWLDAAAAFFVFSEQISAPMGYGLAAEASKNGAQKLADEVRGRVFDFEELIASLKQTGTNS